MKLPILYKYVLLGLLIFFGIECKGNITYNVKDFGAKGDGITDDAPSLLACINKAKGIAGSKVVIPYGRFYIKTAIRIDIDGDQQVNIEGIPDKAGKLPIVFSDKFIDILVVFGNVNSVQGELHVSNIEVKGNNIPFKGEHPYFDKPNIYKIGIGAYNCRRATVKKCIVRDIYGEGLYFGSKLYSKTPLKNRFLSCQIDDVKIYNTWGLNPTPDGDVYDEYGDGIYISNVASGWVRNCLVINDVRKTRQRGRAGIVLEYNVEDFLLERNTVSGYDRNIHMEADIGGNRIIRNTITGSDLGVYIVGFPMSKESKPIEISDNYISNENIPQGIPLRSIVAGEDRALLSFYSKDTVCRRNSIIQRNTFYVTEKSGVVNTMIVRFVGNNLKILSNIYRASAGVRAPELLITDRIGSIKGNTFENISINAKGKSNDYFKRKQVSIGENLLKKSSTNIQL